MKAYNLANELICDLLEKSENTAEYQFIADQHPFPYSEVQNKPYINSFDDLMNTKEIYINPFLRIWNEVIHSECNSLNSNNMCCCYDEKRPVLTEFFNILVHFLCYTDLQLGYTLLDYQKKSLYDDINSNIYGENIKHLFFNLTNHDQHKFLTAICNFNKSDHHTLTSFDVAFKTFFSRSIIYFSPIRRDIFLFIGQPESDYNKDVLNLLVYFLFPITHHLNKNIAWTNHFGIIDNDNTMKIDKIFIMD